MTTLAATVPDPAVVAALLELSGERDLWLRRVLAAERAAYERGFSDGRAVACAELAEMEGHREAVTRWNEWGAKLQRIIDNDRDPSIRLNRVLAEIAADQKFMAEARRKRASCPRLLSPLEACALRRIRLEVLDPGMPREAA